MGGDLAGRASQHLSLELDMADDAVRLDHQIITITVAVGAQQFEGLVTQQQFGSDGTAQMIFQHLLDERRVAGKLCPGGGVTDRGRRQQSCSSLWGAALMPWPHSSFLCPLGATARSRMLVTCYAQAHAPLPLPAGHARMPPGPGKSVTEHA